MCRVIISDSKAARQKLETLGATLAGEYSYKDLIFVPRKADYNLSDDFVRVRVYIKNNWHNKHVVVVRKAAHFDAIGKIDEIKLKMEFDAERQAVDYIQKELGTEFEFGFKYDIQGWQYDLDKHKFFVEDIKSLFSSVEIEADTAEQLKIYSDQIDAKEILKTSLSEAIRRVRKQ
jgi:adenylate cyclase class IV